MAGEGASNSQSNNQNSSNTMQQVNLNSHFNQSNDYTPINNFKNDITQPNNLDNNSGLPTQLNNNSGLSTQSNNNHLPNHSLNIGQTQDNHQNENKRNEDDLYGGVKGLNNHFGSNMSRDDRNNADNIRAATEVAKNSKVPHAAAVGTAVKAADKVTGGKSSEFLGKQMTKMNRSSPVGRHVQNISNGLNESGIRSLIARNSSSKSFGRDGNNKNSSSDDERMQDIINKHQLEHQRSSINNRYGNDDKGEHDSSSSFGNKKRNEFSDSDDSSKMIMILMGLQKLKVFFLDLLKSLLFQLFLFF